MGCRTHGSNIAWQSSRGDASQLSENGYEIIPKIRWNSQMNVTIQLGAKDSNNLGL